MSKQYRRKRMKKLSQKVMHLTLIFTLLLQMTFPIVGQAIEFAEARGTFSGTMTFTVKNAITNAPIPGVTVGITVTNTSTGVTGSDGTYYMDHIYQPSDNYKLIVELPVGYAYGSISANGTTMHMGSNGISTNTFTMGESNYATIYLIPKPSAPTITSTSSTQNSITMNWSGVAGADGYKVYLNGIQKATTGGTSYTFSGLTADTSYTVGVKAYNEAGSSSLTSKTVKTKPNPPPTPTGLSVTNITQTTATLNWNPTSGATSYNVYKNGALVNGNVTGTSYTFTGLSPYTSYTFGVCGENAGGSGGIATKAATTLPNPPDTPTNLKVSDVSQTTATLSWNAAPRAATYDVYLNGVKVAGGLTGTSYTFTGLTADTTYTLGVKAVNTGGQSEMATKEVTTLPDPPDPPTNLVVSDVTQTTAQLSWDPMPRATSYDLYLNGTLVATGITDTTYTFTGLMPNKSYTVGVVAVNIGGSSSEATTDVTTLPYPPNAPTDLQVNSKTQNSAELSWNATSWATSYNVYLDGELVATEITDTSYNFTGLTENTTYMFGVAAVNGEGTSEIVEIAATTLPYAPTLGPTNLTVLSTTQTSATLSWSQVPGATSYNIYQDGVLIASDVTSTTYRVTGLTADTVYTFHVCGVNEGGAGPTSSVSAWTLANVPGAPTGLNTTDVAQTSVTLNWDSTPGADGYYIYLDGLLIGSTSDTSYTFTGLTPETSYTLGVSSYSNGGTSPTAEIDVDTLPNPGALSVVVKDSVTGEDVPRVSFTMLQNGSTEVTGVTPYTLGGLEPGTTFEITDVTLPNGYYTWSVDQTATIVSDVTSTITISIVPNQVESLSVAPPTQSTYNYGERLDLSGLVVTEHWADGSSVILDHSQYTIKLNGNYITNGMEVIGANGFNTTANELVVTDINHPTFTATFIITVVPPDVPTFLSQPMSAVYVSNSTAIPLDAAAFCAKPLSYQWYVNTTNSNTTGQEIPGATGSTYVPPVTSENIGDSYYYCVVTDTVTGEVITSNTAQIKVVLAPPDLVAGPDNQRYPIGSIAIPETVVATSPDEDYGGYLTYQWVETTTPTNTGGTPISGENDPVFTPSTDVIGERYYYCQIWNNYNGETSLLLSSNVATITTTPAAPTMVGTLDDATYYENYSTPVPLSISAVAPDPGEISYSWYRSETPDRSGEQVKVAGNVTSVTPSVNLPAGTYYYYCVAESSYNGAVSDPTYSDMAVITINPTYQVTYDLNGATSGTTPIDKNYYPSGMTATAADASGIERTYFEFRGWNTQPDGNGTMYQPGDQLPVYEDITLYACWEQVYFPVESISIDKDNTTIAVGESDTLTVSFNPSNATNKNITWTSSDESVATVDANGKVTAVGAGTAIITATSEDGNKIAQCTVNVVIPVTGVSLDKTSHTLIYGDSLALNAIFSPSNATNKNVTWTSSNPLVATVDKYGIVRAVGGGTTTITVTTEDGGFQATCIVTVIVPVTGVSLDKSNMTIDVGNSDTLHATINPENADNQNLIWSSDNSAIATVDDNGVVTGINGGTTTITVRTEDGGHSAQCEVTVIVPVEGVSLNKTSASIQIGKTTTLQAKIDPSNATNKDITWRSSNTSVATVDANGVVKGVGNGTVTITAITEDGNYEASCTVTVTVPVTGVTLNKSNHTIETGKSDILVATVSPSNATNKNVTWTTSNPEVAWVDQYGNVRAGGVGTATITVTTQDGGYKDTCTINVMAPSSLTMTNPTYVPNPYEFGDGVSLTGNVSSNYKLTNVTVGIQDKSGKWMPGAYVTVNPNATTYDVHKLQNSIPFSSLKAGDYIYSVVATDTSGKTKILQSTPFSVVAHSQLKMVGSTAVPKMVEKGSPVGVIGNVSSNYMLTNVTVGIKDNSGNWIPSETVSVDPNSTYCDISKYDNDIGFSNLALGDYTYEVQATDVSGTKKVLQSTPFKVIKPSTLGIKGKTSVPSTIYQGTGVSVTGTVSSNYELTNITVGFKSTHDSEWMKGYVSVDPVGMSYNLHNLDSQVKFSSLKPGDYRFVVSASDASGKTKILQDEVFTVVKKPPPPPSSGGTGGSGSDWPSKPPGPPYSDEYLEYLEDVEDLLEWLEDDFEADGDFDIPPPYSEEYVMEIVMEYVLYTLLASVDTDDDISIELILEWTQVICNALAAYFVGTKVASVVGIVSLFIGMILLWDSIVAFIKNPSTESLKKLVNDIFLAGAGFLNDLFGDFTDLFKTIIDTWEEVFSDLN